MINTKPTDTFQKKHHAFPFMSVLLFLVLMLIISCGLVLEVDYLDLVFLIILSGSWLLFVKVYISNYIRIKGIKSFAINPSSWFLLAPIFQCIIPSSIVTFGKFSNYIYTNYAMSVSLWLFMSLFPFLGSSIVEKKCFNKNVFKSIKLFHESKDQYFLIGFLFFVLAVVLRVVAGPIDYHEIHTSIRVIEDYYVDPVKSRLLLFLNNILQFSLVFITMHFVKKNKHSFFRGLLAVCIVASATFYHLYLGNRGALIYLFFPSFIVFAIFSMKKIKIRYLASILLFFFVLFYIGSFARELSIDFSKETHHFDGLSVISKASDGFVNVGLNGLRRMGVSFVLDFIMYDPKGIIPEIDPISVLRVFTIALPSSIFPFLGIVPYPTPYPYADLGYIMAYLFNGTWGTGTAVPPVAEAYWRFGPIGGVAFLLVWGMIIGYIFSIWRRIFPVFGIVLPAIFGLDIMLNETSWVLFARVVREPLIIYVLFSSINILFKKR